MLGEHLAGDLGVHPLIVINDRRFSQIPNIKSGEDDQQENKSHKKLQVGLNRKKGYYNFISRDIVVFLKGI